MPHPERPGSHQRHTYLLSLWPEGGSWRAALRPAGGGPRLGFGDLEQLVAFLLRLQDDRPSAAADPVGPSRKGREVDNQHPSGSLTDDPTRPEGHQPQ